METRRDRRLAIALVLTAALFGARLGAWLAERAQ
jgi:hypothetical protein